MTLSSEIACEALSRRDLLRRGAAGGALLAAGALLDACGGSSSTAASTAAGSSTGTPKRGGSINLGLVGGNPNDTLDPHKGLDATDAARVQQLYNSLVVLRPDASIEYDLATSITPDAKATEWTFALRKGVTFHSGTPLTADDVIFTLKRVLNPKAPLAGAVALGPMDFNRIRKLDSHTVRVTMKAPFSTLVEQMASYFYFLGVVPTGFDPKKPDGTGPFKFQSFTPGQRSTFVRNAHYWKPGLPYLDSLVVTDFADDSALANAIMSGQIDAAAQLPAAEVAALSGNSDVTVIHSRSGSFQPFTMRVDQAPFNDVRVRQAFRLLVDRPQFVASGLAGSGFVGNDVFSPFDPTFDKSLVRHQDIAQAKSLLKAAGQQNLTIQLVTAPINQGTVQMAEVYAQQAKAAGVTVNVRQLDTTTFFGPQYLKWTFSQDYWLYNPYLAQVAQAMLPTSPFNETHFNNSRYTSLYAQANAALDPAKRAEIAREMQLIDFNEGSYIIPAFVTVNDAFRANVKGLGTSSIGESLSNFGFESAYVA